MSSAGEGTSTSSEGLPDLPVPAEIPSMGLKGSATREGLSRKRRGKEGDVGEGWLDLRLCLCSNGYAGLVVLILPIAIAADAAGWVCSFCLILTSFAPRILVLPSLSNQICTLQISINAKVSMA